MCGERMNNFFKKYRIIIGIYTIWITIHIVLLIISNNFKIELHSKFFPFTKHFYYKQTYNPPTYGPYSNPFVDISKYDLSEFIIYCFGPIILPAYIYFLHLCFKRKNKIKKE